MNGLYRIDSGFMKNSESLTCLTALIFIKPASYIRSTYFEVITLLYEPIAVFSGLTLLATNDVSRLDVVKKASFRCCYH